MGMATGSIEALEQLIMGAQQGWEDYLGALRILLMSGASNRLKQQTVKLLNDKQIVETAQRVLEIRRKDYIENGR